ncbi:TetR family transcriptional regulator [Reticulibacter mediterranei]|uniref:TetR family transcriptional regulator n=1 Tax=Reticulibacter mediterranei TaxID=2778369 RepID=A0A8J3N864_9CHLR|nr:TetR/AcrR family transcriptional regulator [Reticulibacter mediterranei]GHO99205.1 TetR family transcriptional regulator [Reticulibacter mediterranei]
MGIKERRAREKQVTRENILAAAHRIARQEGWPALTIRKVADEIEYSTPMIYEYFANKEEILLELMREGYQQLMASMQQARLSTEDLRERLFRIVDAYWGFARNNPELYQIMNGLGGVPLPIEETARAGREAGMVSVAAVEDWAQENGIVLEDSFGAVELAWSLMHGMVSLTLAERIEGGEPRARRLLHQGIEALLTSGILQKSSG